MPENHEHYPSTTLTPGPVAGCDDSQVFEMAENAKADINDEFILLDDHWRCVDANEAAAAALNVRPEQLLGKDFWEVMPSAAETSLGEPLRRAMVERRPVRIEHLARCGRRCETRAYPTAQSGLALFTTDVTDQKRVEEVQSQLAAIVASSDDAILTKRLDGTITSWNRGAERLYGYTAEEAVGRPVSLIAPEDRADEISAIMDRLRRGERIDHYETVRQRKDGTLLDISVTISPLQDGEGRTVGASAVGRDITERKRAEEVQNQLAAIVASSEDAILTKTLEGTITSWNRGAERLYGYTAEEAVGRSVSLIAPEDRADEIPAIMDRLRRGERIDHYETVRQRKDGTLLDISVTISPLHDGKGRVVGASAVGRDITERKRAEKAIHASERRERARADELEALMHAVPAVVFLARDPECREVTGSRAANELLRLPAGANLSKSASETNRRTHFRVLKDGAELSQEQMPLQRAARGEEIQGEEIEIRFDDGSVVYLFGNAIPLRDEVGEPRGALAAMLDVSQRKRLIDELKRLNQKLELRVAERTEEIHRQADRLRRLAGELSAAEQRERRRIAQLLHDHIQQLLVAAKMQIEMLGGRGTDSGDFTVEEVSKLLKEAIEASRNLSHELYPPVLYDHGLAAALHWLSRRFGERHGLNVEVEAETEADPPQADLQAFLFQAVHELLLNALKHGGATRAWVTMHRRDGVLTLSIEDNGAGCEPGKLYQQPEGGAFGLFSIQERLSMLDGTTSVRSAPEEGCCIVLRLPA